jgi:hypothetical protein
MWVCTDVNRDFYKVIFQLLQLLRIVSYRGETLNSITQVAGRNVIICLKVVSFLIKIIFIFFTDFKIWYWDLRLKDWNVLSANMAF